MRCGLQLLTRKCRANVLFPFTTGTWLLLQLPGKHIAHVSSFHKSLYREHLVLSKENTCLHSFLWTHPTAICSYNTLKSDLSFRRKVDFSPSPEGGVPPCAGKLGHRTDLALVCLSWHINLACALLCGGTLYPKSLVSSMNGKAPLGRSLCVQLEESGFGYSIGWLAFCCFHTNSGSPLQGGFLSRRVWQSEGT